jgi:hypothetical protein
MPDFAKEKFMQNFLKFSVISGFLFSLLIQSNAVFAQATQPAAQTDVPVKTVVLFSSGVGYFEHFGTVTGNGSTELRFKTDQINDILKSLLLEDMDGGKVSSVLYPSQDPIEKTLKSFQVDITGNPPLGDLLNQLRGAKLTVTKSDGSKVSGIILGVEKKDRPAQDDPKTIIHASVLNLLTGASIHSIRLDQLDDIQLDDPALQEELTKALAALAQSRDQDKKPVDINFRGDGDRRVRIGYVIETPIWKTSYRLMLPGDAKDKAKLQGWAIVENQTDNDWNGVQLSLVSGRPISFVQNLYSPLYIPRPVVQPELYASLNPTLDQGGIAAAKASRRLALSQNAPLAEAGAEAPGGAIGGALEAGRDRRQLTDKIATATPAPPMNPTASVTAAASGSQLGELFQYTVSDPVNLPRQKSAMLPIITDNVDCEKLSVYNASVLPKNPLNGVQLKNTTGKHLLQGPVTVLESNSYAGDARIDNLPPGQERLLTYGIDLQMTIDSTKNTQTNDIKSAKIVKGVLMGQRKLVFSQDYVADNKSDHAKTLIIEHPIHQGWQLDEPKKPMETTDTLYRFKGNVDPDKTSTLTVKEEQVQEENFEILGCDVGTLQSYQQTGAISKEVRDALIKAMQLRQAVADLQQQVQEHDAQIQAIRTDQAPIRENMKTVDRSGQYFKRLETKLNDQETQIEKLQSERDDLNEKQKQAQKDFEDYLSGLTVG